jgi:hypothetical protein
MQTPPSTQTAAGTSDKSEAVLASTTAVNTALMIGTHRVAELLAPRRQPGREALLGNTYTRGRGRHEPGDDLQVGDAGYFNSDET